MNYQSLKFQNKGDKKELGPPHINLIECLIGSIESRLEQEPLHI